MSGPGDPNPPKPKPMPPQETVERPPRQERPEDVEYNKSIDEYWTNKDK